MFKSLFFLVSVFTYFSTENIPEYIPIVIEFKEKCAIDFYLSQKNLKSNTEELLRQTREHIEKLKSIQDEFTYTINRAKSNTIIRLFSAQRVFNGMGCYVSSNEIEKIVNNEFVKAIHPLGKLELHLSTSIPSLGVPRIWNDYLATGRGIKIAVIDSGIDYIHPTFGGSGNPGDYNANNPTLVEENIKYPNEKIIGGYDFVGEEYNPEIPGRQIPNPDPDPFDQLGHGTHVAGIIGGYGVLNNGSTYNGNYDLSTLNTYFSVAPGVAPNCQIYALKIFSVSPKTEILIPAIEWAVDPNQDGDFNDKADIINLSLGEDYGFSDTPECVACENAFKIGTLVVASAGNRGDSFYAFAMPASAPSAIGVSAYEDPDPTIPLNTPYKVAYFSSRGPSISSNNRLLLKPDLSAPGIWIFSANMGSSPLGRMSSGTSMSAPHISGIAGLLKEISHSSSPSELKTLLINNSIYGTILKKGDSTYSAGPTTGGAGRLDLSNSFNLDILVYDSENPNEVALTFDLWEISEDTQITKWLRIKNLSGGSKSFHIQTIPYVNPQGVYIFPMEFEAGPIPESQYIDVPITINAQYSEISNFRDPSIYIRSSETKRAWVSEFYGKIVVENLTDNTFMSIPFYSQVKPASKLEILPKEINVTKDSHSILQIHGLHLNTGTNYPIDLLSFYGIFEVVDVSDRLKNLAGYLSCGDINFVAIADDYPYLPEGSKLKDSNIYFLISTYSPWSTPNQIKFKVYIDVDGDDTTDFILSNTYTYEFQPPSPSSDVFVSMLENNKTLEMKILYPLYGYSADKYDMNPFRNNTIILPIKASDIELDEQKTSFRFYCESILTKDIPLLVDQAPIQTPGEPKKRYTYDIKNKPVSIVESGKTKVIEPTLDAGEIQCSINVEKFSELKRKGLLCYFSHNPLAERVQFIPIITHSEPDGEEIEGYEEAEIYEGGSLEGEGISEGLTEGEGEIHQEGEGGAEEGNNEGFDTTTEGEECIDGMVEGEGLINSEGEEQQEEGEASTFISPPRNLTASDGTYDDFILLTWEPSEDCINCEYEVFKGDSNKLENSIHIADVKLPFYFDYPSDASQKRTFCGCLSTNEPIVYYYWVRAKLIISPDKVLYSNFSEPDAGWLKRKSHFFTAPTQRTF
ncbi:MAG: S8 family serine peptidase [Candidatus Hydrogenedentes bacterium]|nr:S8 family serine peptidase [Candidatus Hydrogenedentota bacterium]